MSCHPVFRCSGHSHAEDGSELTNLLIKSITLDYIGEFILPLQNRLDEIDFELNRLDVVESELTRLDAIDTELTRLDGIDVELARLDGIDTELEKIPVVNGKVPDTEVSTADGSTQNLKNAEFSLAIAKQKLDTGITVTTNFDGVVKTQADVNSAQADINAVQAEINAVQKVEAALRNVVSVLDFYSRDGSTSDQEAFQAAVDSLPELTDLTSTGNKVVEGEIPRGTVRVPMKPTGLSTDTQNYYQLVDYIDPGVRSITWDVDDGVRFGSHNNSYVYLNDPYITSRSNHQRGFSNGIETTNQIITSGPGSHSAESRSVGISRYKPDTVMAQSYIYERGRAGQVINISDSSNFNVRGTGVTYTRSGCAFSTPLPSKVTGHLRYGMLIDTVGDLYPNQNGTSLIRYTSRIISVVKNAKNQATALILEPWYRADPNRTPYTAGIEETPPDGQSLVINPVNKLWNTHWNAFLSNKEGDTYGHTSASFLEAGLFNNTGKAVGTEFSREGMPMHFWGLDLSNVGNHGGGVGTMIRCNPPTNTWTIGHEVRGADIGFHFAGHISNQGKSAFVVSSGYVGNVKQTGGTPKDAFLARVSLNNKYDRVCRIAPVLPDIELGYRNTPSHPRIKFYSDGLAGTDDDKYNGSIASEPGGISVSSRSGIGLKPGNTVALYAKASGAINFIPLTEAPTPAKAGDVYFDSTLGKLRCFGGGIWNDLF